MHLRWDVAWDNLPFLLGAVVNTIEVSVASIVLGLVIGWLLGLFSVSHTSWLKRLTFGYVQFFRGTPLLVQILLVYFGIAGLGLNLSAFQAGVLALGLNTGAYTAEIVRGAIESIYTGQTDAANSIGLSRLDTMLLILLPQAVRRSVPGVTNELVSLVKASSLLAVIGMLELTHAGQMTIARTFTPFEIYIEVALIYLMLTAVLSVGTQYLERNVFVNY
jgi:His/Glu/Gln/Arg/opine family amino acid ABC transporter permease subunit